MGHNGSGIFEIGCITVSESVILACPLSCWIFSLILIELSCMHEFTNRMENSVDPDQLTFQKPADVGLHSFQKCVAIGNS